MKGILIAAGRGQRLDHLTLDQPKCFTEIGGKRIVDWILEAFHQAGLKEIIFIGGYLIDLVRKEYPHFQFVHNDDWQNNNILESLFYAERYMDQGFVCSYSDILYHGNLISEVLAHPGDMGGGVDREGRNRYIERTEHPETDGEKVNFEGDKLVYIHRDILPEAANGEYTGVAKFSARGAQLLKQHYFRVKEEFTRRPWREASRTRTQGASLVASRRTARAYGCLGAGNASHGSPARGRRPTHHCGDVSPIQIPPDRKRS